MLDNFEYTFFDLALAQKFAKKCESMGLKVALREDESPTGEALHEVSVNDAMTDAQVDSVEEVYGEMLFGEQADQIEGSDVNALVDACGVQVQLQSGDFTTVAIHPDTMNKILSVLTIDELQKFLAQVAEDIENPKSGPICQRGNIPVL